MTVRQKISAAVSGAGIALCLPVVAFAATTTVVTSANTQGWSTQDTRANGSVTFAADAPAMFGSGALRLKTGASTPSPSQDKAQYMHGANTPLSDVTNLSYYTKQVSASFAGGDPSYQLVLNLNGATGFTTLVYEPYQQNSTVTPEVWQNWDVDNGQFWSSRSVTCTHNGVGTGTSTVAGGGGTYFYSLAQLKAGCPDATVIGFGVNIGSANPNYDTLTDGVQFNNTTYDFEVTNLPTSKDGCKKDGYKNFTDEDGNGFKNQGQCVSFVETSSHQPSVVAQVRNFFGL
jgi:hypothetical protein